MKKFLKATSIILIILAIVCGSVAVYLHFNPAEDKKPPITEQSIVNDNFTDGYPIINLSRSIEFLNYFNNLKLENENNIANLNVVSERYYLHIKFEDAMYNLHAEEVMSMVIMTKNNEKSFQFDFEFNTNFFKCNFYDFDGYEAESAQYCFTTTDLEIDLIFEADKITLVGYTIEDYQNGSGDYSIITIESGTEQFDLINDIFSEEVMVSCNFFDNSDLNWCISMTENYNVMTELNIPPREGYTFQGLYYDENYTQPYTGDPIKPLEELYQKWEINTYTITFDSRTVEEPLLDLVEKTYNYGDIVDFVPERDGYQFVCWINDATNQEFDGVVKSDMYLRAKWEIKKLKVIYMEEDGTILYEQFIAIGEHGGNYYPRKVGYKFIGWKEFEDVPIFADETIFTAMWQEAKCTITLFINNNVHKAYSVDFDMPLSDFLVEIGVDQRFVAKYNFSDYSGSQIPISEINVVKDLRIDLSDSYLKNNDFKEIINDNKELILISLGGIGILILVSIFGAIFGKKHKHKKR